MPLQLAAGAETMRVRRQHETAPRNRISQKENQVEINKQLLERLASDDFERCTDYMYLDTKGNVTIGVGYKLSSATEAAALPFDIPKATLDAWDAELAKSKTT